MQGPPVAESRVVSYATGGISAGAPPMASVVDYNAQMGGKGGGGGGGGAPPGFPPQPAQAVAVGVITGTVVGPGFGEAYQIRDENALAAPGYDAGSFAQPARHKSCLSKLATATVVLVVVAALAVVVVGMSSEDEPTYMPDRSAVVDTGPRRCVRPPPVSNGALQLDLQSSQEGLPTNAWYVGHAAQIVCNQGFALAAPTSDTAVCWGTGWTPKIMPSCDSTAPLAPPPQPVYVVTQVFSQTQATSAAAAIPTSAEIAAEARAGGPPAVEVTATVAFPVAIETIAEGTPERAAFEAGFVTSMAAELGGVDESSITVNGISAGSPAAGRRLQAAVSTAVVDWTLTAPFSQRAQAASLVTTLSDYLTGGSTSLVVTIAGRPIAAGAIFPLKRPIPPRKRLIFPRKRLTSLSKGLISY